MLTLIIGTLLFFLYAHLVCRVSLDLFPRAQKNSQMSRETFALRSNKETERCPENLLYKVSLLTLYNPQGTFLNMGF